MADESVELYADLRLKDTTTFERQLRDLENKAIINIKVPNSQPLGRLTGQVSEFDKSLEAANARVLAFGASAAVIGGVTLAIRSMITESINLNKELTQINVYLKQSDSSLNSFKNSIFEIAKNTGATFDDAVKAAGEFARQGGSAAEIIRKTNDAMILARISGINFAKAVEDLTAQTEQFSKEGLSTTDVINKIANVSQKFAIDAKNLEEGLVKVGSAVDTSKVSFDQLAAVIASVRERTGRDANSIASAVTSIFSRVQKPETITNLENIGIAMRDAQGNALPLIDTVKQIAKSYDSLGESQKAYVNSLAGGARSVSTFRSLLADLSRENSQYDKVLRQVATSSDQAIKQNDALNQSLSATINKAQQNFKQLAAGAGDLVFTPLLKRIFGEFNEASEGLNGSSIGQKIGQGILAGIGNVLSGPGLVIGATLVGRLLVQFGQFSGEALGNLVGIGRASQNVQNVQKGINQLLVEDASLREIIGNSTISQETKERAVIASIETQIALLKERAALSEALATTAVESGISFNSGKFVKRAANGYIPSAGIAASEVEGARRAGYSIQPSDVRAMETNIGGHRATVIYNTKEKVIDNFRGTGEPAIIPPTVGFAGGFEPYGDFKVQRNGFNFSRLPKTSSVFGELGGFLRGNLGLKKSDLAKVLFSGFSEPGNSVGGRYFRENNQIHIYQDEIAKRIAEDKFGGVGLAQNQREKFLAYLDKKMSNLIAHEGFHNAYAKNPALVTKRFRTLADKSFFFPENDKQALDFVTKHYGDTQKEKIAETYSSYASEEALAIQFPRLLGFAGGYLPKVFAATGINLSDLSESERNSKGILSALAREKNIGVSSRDTISDLITKIRKYEASENARNLPTGLPIDSEAQEYLRRRESSNPSKSFDETRFSPLDEAAKSLGPNFVLNPESRIDSNGRLLRNLIEKDKQIQARSYEQYYNGDTSSPLVPGTVAYDKSLYDSEYQERFSAVARYKKAKFEKIRAALSAPPPVSVPPSSPSFFENLRAKSGSLFSFQNPETRARVSQAYLQLGLIAPLAGGVASQFIPNQQVSRGVSEATNAVGIGATLASIGGPVGVAVGGLTASFLTLKSVINNLTPNFEDLQKELSKNEEKRNNSQNSLQSFLETSENLEELKASGASESQLKRASKKVRESFGGLSSDQTKLFGGDFSVENIKKVIDSSLDKNNKERNDDLFAANLRLSSDADTRFGFKRRSVSRLADFLGGSVDSSKYTGGEKFNDSVEDSLISNIDVSKVNVDNVLKNYAKISTGRQRDNFGDILGFGTAAGLDKDKINQLIDEKGFDKATQIVLNSLAKLASKTKEAAEKFNKELEGVKLISTSLAENRRLAALSIQAGFNKESDLRFVSFQSSARNQFEETRGNLFNRQLDAARGEGLSFFGSSQAGLNNSLSSIQNKSTIEQDSIRATALASLKNDFTAPFNEVLQRLNLEGRKNGLTPNEQTSIGNFAQFSNGAPSDTDFDFIKSLVKSKSESSATSEEQAKFFSSQLEVLEKIEQTKKNIDSATSEELKYNQALANVQKINLQTLYYQTAELEKRKTLSSRFDFNALSKGPRDISSLTASSKSLTDIQAFRSAQGEGGNRTDFRGLTPQGRIARSNDIDVLNIAAGNATQAKLDAGLGLKVDDAAALLESNGTLLSQKDFDAKNTGEDYAAYRQRVIDGSPFGAVLKREKSQLAYKNLSLANQDIKNILKTGTSNFLTDYSKAAGKFGGGSYIGANTSSKLQQNAEIGNVDNLLSFISKIEGSGNKQQQEIVSRFKSDLQIQKENQRIAPEQAALQAEKAIGSDKSQLLTDKTFVGWMQTFQGLITGAKSQSESSTPITVQPNVTISINSTASSEDLFKEFRDKTEKAIQDIVASVNGVVDFSKKNGYRPVPTAPAQ